MGKFFLYALIIFAVFFVLFVPILLHTDFYYQIRSKKVGFCVTLYGKIKLFGGYISTYQGGIAVHFSQKRALLTGYREMDEQRKKYPLRDFFDVKKVSLNIRTGADYLFPLYALKIVTSIVLHVRPDYREHITSRLSLENGDELKLSARVVLKSSLFRQCKGFIKYIVRRKITTWKMKKSMS